MSTPRTRWATDFFPPGRAIRMMRPVVRSATSASPLRPGSKSIPHGTARPVAMVRGLLAAAPAWLPSACAVSSARVSVAGAGAAAESSEESLPQAARAAAERAAVRAIGRRAVMALKVARRVKGDAGLTLPPV